MSELTSRTIVVCVVVASLAGCAMTDHDAFAIMFGCLLVMVLSA